MRTTDWSSVWRVALAVYLVSSGSPIPIRAAAVRSAGHVEEIRNGAVPRHGLDTIEAVEVWRVGGDDDEHIFGAIARVIAGPSGNTYVLDGQQAEVQVFTAAGEYQRTLSREGDGPGEVRGPLDICLFPDGVLGIVQPFPGKLIKVNQEGDPAGTLEFGSGDPGAGGFAVLMRGLMRGGALILGGMSITYSNDGSSSETRFFVGCDEHGREEHRYFSQVSAVDYGNLRLSESGQDFAWDRCALGPAGRLYLAPERNEYRIEIHSSAGEIERVVTREYESLKRSPEQLQAARERLEAYARYFPTPPREITVEETEPDISALWVTTAGRLWVRTSAGDDQLLPGILTTFDIFDPQGGFERQVALRCPGDPRRDSLFLLDQGRLVVVVGGVNAALAQQGVATPDEAEETDEDPEDLEIICYHLTP